MNTITTTSTGHKGSSGHNNADNQSIISDSVADHPNGPSGGVHGGGGGGVGGDGQVPNSRRPSDHALKQQRMKSWQPLLDPKWVISAYLLIGIVFIPTGIVLQKKSDDLIELKTIYESHLKKGPPADVAGCEIGNSTNKMYLADPANPQTCQIKMIVPPDGGGLRPPVLIHYELSNFYQNYRKYTQSRDQYQLFGRSSEDQDSVSAEDCAPLNKIGDIWINPCGLIANTLFNDVITLESIVAPDGTVLENAPMVETGIAWKSDLEYVYRQPNGFESFACASCDDPDCTCDGVSPRSGANWSCKSPYVDADGRCHLYHYPDDDTTQYLYETYPMVVSPLEGVLNEHFVVWMRTAALPHFRKLYGYVEVPVPAGSVLTFNVQANFAVQRNRGAKALVVGESYAFGGKNRWLGTLFVAVGGVAACLGALFLAKEVWSPRRLGDRAYLKFKAE